MHSQIFSFIQNWSRSSLDIKQKLNTKAQRIEHKLKINITKKKTEDPHEAYCIREERGPRGCGSSCQGHEQLVAKNFPCAKFEKQIERWSVEEENYAEIEEKRESRENVDSQR